jgi:hypothetical protein
VVVAIEAPALKATLHDHVLVRVARSGTELLEHRGTGIDEGVQGHRPVEIHLHDAVKLAQGMRHLTSERRTLDDNHGGGMTPTLKPQQEALDRFGDPIDTR